MPIEGFFHLCHNVLTRAAFRLYKSMSALISIPGPLLFPQAVFEIGYFRRNPAPFFLLAKVRARDSAAAYPGCLCQMVERATLDEEQLEVIGCSCTFFGFDVAGSCGYGGKQAFAS
jgi:hypothetical protein